MLKQLHFPNSLRVTYYSGVNRIYCVILMSLLVVCPVLTLSASGVIVFACFLLHPPCGLLAPCPLPPLPSEVVSLWHCLCLHLCCVGSLVVVKSPGFIVGILTSF